MHNQKWILTGVIALMLAGCATTKGDWGKAQRLDTVQSYQEFLSKHPQSEFTAVARGRIQKLHWQRAKQLDTIESYQEFISKYPEGKFSDKAKARTKDLLDWKKTQQVNTIKKYQEFLQKHPDSEFATEARSSIEKLHFEQAKSEDTIQGYEEFLRRYPGGKLADQARLRIEKLHFQEAEAKDTFSAYEEFLKKHPQGRFADKVRSKLKALRIEQEAIRGREANKFENKMMELMFQGKVGDRFVIKSIQPAASDKYGRGAQKATVKKYNDEKIAIIGRYWEQDGDLSMPGGRIFSAREGGYFQVGFGGLLLYRGAARFLEDNEKLEEFLPMLPGSIHRFIGEIDFGGYTFKGTEDDPLTFGLVRDVGYVYLHGKGIVTFENGRKVELD